MKITMQSPLSGEYHTMELPVTQEQLEVWKSGGGLIQEVFPELTSDEREFLKTGLTPEDWLKIFGA